MDIFHSAGIFSLSLAELQAFFRGGRDKSKLELIRPRVTAESADVSVTNMDLHGVYLH